MKYKGRNKDIHLFPLDLKAERPREMARIQTITCYWFICLQGHQFGLGSLHQREASFQPPNNVLFLAVCLEKGDEEKVTD